MMAAKAVASGTHCGVAGVRLLFSGSVSFVIGHV